MKEERKSKIVALVNEKEILSFDMMMDEFDVSSATIRRDIEELAADGLIQKTRGGILSMNRRVKDEPSLRLRSSMNMDEKRRMAAAASQFIEDGDCIAIASGTSVLELAKLLKNDLRLNIVTYDLLVALELANRAQFDVLMIGGSIKKAYYSTHGYFAEDMMKKIRVDKAFISADAIDLKQGIMGYTSDDIGTKTLLLKSASQVFLLCDHTKFDTRAFIKICDLSCISHIITGEEIDQTILKSIVDMGIRVTTV